MLKQCALEKDLALWEAGDQTEVGEKGLTLRYFANLLNIVPIIKVP